MYEDITLGLEVTPCICKRGFNCDSWFEGVVSCVGKGMVAAVALTMRWSVMFNPETGSRKVNGSSLEIISLIRHTHQEQTIIYTTGVIEKMKRHLRKRKKTFANPPPSKGLVCKIHKEKSDQ